MLITELLLRNVNNGRYTQEQVRQAIREKGIEYLKLSKQYHSGMVTAMFLDEVDKAVGREVAHQRLEGQISCTKGCAACCRSLVTISREEARLLASHVITHQMEVDEERLVKQEATSPQNWNKLTMEERTCVFLDEEESCSVYEVRPGVCRKHMVVSSPENCHAESPVGALSQIVSYEAEILVSTWWQIKESGSMAKMLLAEIRNS